MTEDPPVVVAYSEGAYPRCKRHDVDCAFSKSSSCASAYLVFAGVRCIAYNSSQVIRQSDRLKYLTNRLRGIR